MTSTHALRRTRRQSGLTLIELMIAMILGLVVMAGVVSVFLAGQQSFRTNDALADVQDSARVAFELMARDIREAGLTGCNSVNGRIANVLANGPGAATVKWWADWDSNDNNPLRGFDAGMADPALPASSNRVTTEGSLELLSAASDPAAVDAYAGGTDFVLQAQSTMPSFSAGDIIVACTPGEATIFQASGYTSATRTLTVGATGAGAPGNTSTNLGWPTNTSCSAPNPPCFPTNSLVAKLTAVDWYIGTNAEGTDSLYRLTLQNTAGTPAPVAQEMVRGVTHMSIAYLNPDIAAISNGFQSAATISSKNGWPGVSAVRVTLWMESAFKRADVSGGKPIQRTYSFTTNLRNRVN